MIIIGEPVTAHEFPAYLATLRMRWQPSGVCLHHCAAPSLAQRPHGFTRPHMANLREFYESKGWSAGPHLFIDDDQIWLFSPIDRPGVHAVSFNRTHIGIEVLGDYDVEDPRNGRGLACWLTARAAYMALCEHLRLDPVLALAFHRDDPRTRKSCPGGRVSKSWFIGLEPLATA